jgi:cytochrome c oxidase cbb3-type subunit 3
MRLRCAAVLACVALAACSPREPATTRADHEAGRQIYNFRCYFCHGYSGDARTLAASMIEPAPRDFTRARDLDERRVLTALRKGVPGTAMASFAGTLSSREMELVARFVLAEFVQAQRPNTHYHTAANGWPRHERYASAFPFATGEIALDRPDASLSNAEREGKALFMSACISCHDRARVLDTGAPWQSGLDANQVAPGARP